MSDWPHVTSILKAAGLYGDLSRIPHEYLELGSAVHKATEYLDAGDLDMDSLDPRVAPRVASYQKFLNDLQPTFHATELPVENEGWRYCGTLDRLVEIGGHRGVLDLKGVCDSLAYGPQLAAYQRCVGVGAWPKRWALFLSDERYKLVEKTASDDWGAFCASLTLHSWRQNHA